MKKSRLLCAALAVAALAVSAFAASPPVRESPPGFERPDVAKSAPAVGATMTITAETGLGAASAFKAFEAQRAAMRAPVQRTQVHEPAWMERKVSFAAALGIMPPPDEPRVVWRLRWLRT